MSVCSICRGAHHAASCRHRVRTRGQDRSGPGSPTPQGLVLTPDQLDDLAYRAKENRPFTRAEKDALIAMARAYLLVDGPKPAVLDDGAWINFLRLQNDLMSMGSKGP